jgi:hypothetical protein
LQGGVDALAYDILFTYLFKSVDGAVSTKLFIFNIVDVSFLTALITVIMRY